MSVGFAVSGGFLNASAHRWKDKDGCEEVVVDSADLMDVTLVAEARPDA